MRAQWTMLSIWGILILATPLCWTCVPVSKFHSTLQCLLCFCLWDSYLFSVILLLLSFFSFQVFFTSRTPVLPRHALVSSVTESNCHSALHCQLLSVWLCSAFSVLEFWSTSVFHVNHIDSHFHLWHSVMSFLGMAGTFRLTVRFFFASNRCSLVETFTCGHGRFSVFSEIRWVNYNDVVLLLVEYFILCSRLFLLLVRSYRMKRCLDPRCILHPTLWAVIVLDEPFFKFLHEGVFIMWCKTVSSYNFKPHGLLLFR